MSDSGDSDHIYPALVTILRRVEISSLGWYDNNKSLLILTLGDAVEDWRGGGGGCGVVTKTDAQISRSVASLTIEYSSFIQVKTKFFNPLFFRWKIGSNIIL